MLPFFQPDWIFPTDVLEIIGPSFILLPSTPPTCLAWNPTLQRVYAAAVTLPVAPEGEDELTLSEALEVVEPTDVNHVWVVARLSGNEDVITLRSSSLVFHDFHHYPSDRYSRVANLSTNLQRNLPHGSSFRRSFRFNSLTRSA